MHTNTSLILAVSGRTRRSVHRASSAPEWRPHPVHPWVTLLGLWLVLTLCACSRDNGFCPSGMAPCEEGCQPEAEACETADGGADAEGGKDADSLRADASLLSLSLSAGMLSPAFAPTVTMYQAAVSYDTRDVQVSASPKDPRARLTINGLSTQGGMPSAPIAIGTGVTMIEIRVLAGDAEMKSYTIAVSRWPSLYMKASNTQASDRFGTRLSLSGDTLAVSAPEEDSSATGVNGDQTDNSATNSGAVYIFQRIGTTWVQQAYLKASNTGAGDWFGRNLSLSGDTLAVSADSEDSGATGVNGNQADNSAMNSGAVYVFQRVGTVWTQQAYIKASNTEAMDSFGASVSLSGDTLAVGAYGEASSATGINGNQADNSLKNSGAVYVFQRAGTTWTQQAYIKASNTGLGDNFGSSVSLSGDTLAVAAGVEDSSATGVNGNQADNSGTDSGAVYVFQRAGTVWSQQAYIKASNTQAGAQFGGNVSLSGDTLAVSALSEAGGSTGVNGNQADQSASQSGAVYVFQRTGTTWTQQAYVKATNTEAGDMFGGDLSLSGDVLAVGSVWESSNAILIGGNQADNSAKTSGAVYVYRRTGSTWAPRAYVKASNTQAGDWFGIGIAVSGETLAVGAWNESSKATGINGDQSDNSAGRSGAVYIYR